MKRVFQDSDFSPLTVADFIDCEQFLRDRRRREVIADLKELYGDRLPPDAFQRVKEEVQKVKLLTLAESGQMDLQTVQYLLWLSLKKKNPALTLQDISESITPEMLEPMLKNLLGGSLPSGQADVSEKKTDLC